MSKRIPFLRTVVDTLRELGVKFRLRELPDDPGLHIDRYNSFSGPRCCDCNVGIGSWHREGCAFLLPPKRRKS